MGPLIGGAGSFLFGRYLYEHVDKLTDHIAATVVVWWLMRRRVRPSLWHRLAWRLLSVVLMVPVWMYLGFAERLGLGDYWLNLGLVVAGYATRNVRPPKWRRREQAVDWRPRWMHGRPEWCTA